MSEAPHIAVARLVLTEPAAADQAEKLRCHLEEALATAPLHSVWSGDEWDGAVLWPLGRGTLTAAVEQLDDLIPATKGRVLLDQGTIFVLGSDHQRICGDVFALIVRVLLSFDEFHKIPV